MDAEPIASFRPPERADYTWFSSGRGALLFLLLRQKALRRIVLPSIICPALVEAIRLKFPKLEIDFYLIDRHLQPRFPAQLAAESMLLVIHFFGYHSERPNLPGAQIIEDWSHTLLAPPKQFAGHVFASLRKLYPIADGGLLLDRVNVDYEHDETRQSWTRHELPTWQSAQLAERQLDRLPAIADISSQSLHTVLGTNPSAVALRRRSNEALLRKGLRGGRALRPFSASECPLAHMRVFDSQSERDALRQHLVASNIFTSVQWPAMESLPEPDKLRIEAEAWANLHLAFPVGEHLDEPHMQHIVSACARWRAG